MLGLAHESSELPHFGPQRRAALLRHLLTHAASPAAPPPRPILALMAHLITTMSHCHSMPVPVTVPQCRPAYPQQTINTSNLAKSAPAPVMVLLIRGVEEEFLRLGDGVSGIGR
jgi:hypothetical protein